MFSVLERKNLTNENIKLKEENERLKNLMRTKDKIINAYERRKNMYEKIILNRAISWNNYIKKQKKQIKEAIEEDEEEI